MKPITECAYAPLLENNYSKREPEKSALCCAALQMLMRASLRWALWNPRKYLGASLECAFNCGQISLLAAGEMDVAQALLPGNKRCNLLFKRQSFDGGGKFSRARKQRNYIIRENTECKLHIGAHWQSAGFIYLPGTKSRPAAAAVAAAARNVRNGGVEFSLYLHNHIHKCSRQRQSRLTVQELILSSKKNLHMQMAKCIEEWKKS